MPGDPGAEADGLAGPWTGRSGRGFRVTAARGAVETG
jgi:hypothetical protein